MARMVYAINCSLDGYISDENGEFDWSEPSEDLHAYFNELVRSWGTQLYGRRMYETMAVWETFGTEPDAPPVIREFGEFWRDSDKVVYSASLAEVSTARTRIERTFDPAAVARMKDEADTDLGIGGPALAASALRAGLVDELQLVVVPVVVGGGVRALPAGLRVDLELMEQRSFSNGAVALRYDVRR